VHPQIPAADAAPDTTRSGGQGLLLVTALTDHWECVPHPAGGKTVRAELLDTGPA